MKCKNIRVRDCSGKPAPRENGGGLAAESPTRRVTPRKILCYKHIHTWCRNFAKKSGYQK